MTRVGLIIGLAAVTGLTGCGDDTPARTDLPYELYCNIADGNCQRQIYNSVATMLEATEFDPPPIRTISVDQHAAEVRSGIDLQDLTGEDPETRGLRLIGFLPEASESLTATQIEYWINQIAAYYNPNDDVITVVDRDYEEVLAQGILAHEFTHAIQQRQFGFTGVYAGVDTEDGAMGARSVIEGDATHTEYSWVYELQGYLPSEIDWAAIHDDRQARLKAVVEDPEVALIDTASSFPYAYGFEFMTKLASSIGLRGREIAFETPPGTAFEVISGPEAAPLAFDFPEMAHPSPVEGHTEGHENRYGAWYVYGFLRRAGASDDEAWITALTWRGDELAIFDDGSEVVAVWRVRFDEAASTVRDLVNANATERSQTALLYEQDVFVLAAETNESLLAWAERPLDSMSAALVLKDGRRRGGPVSVGGCVKSLDFSLPNPPPLLH